MYHITSDFKWKATNNTYNFCGLRHRPYTKVKTIDMPSASGFFDMCIQETCLKQEGLEQTIKLLYDLGYRTIAINQLIDEGNVEPRKKKKKGEPRDLSNGVPIPFDIEQVKKIALKLKFQDFKVYNRLTVIFSNQEVLHKITKSPNYKKFHIIAALPTTMQAFMFTCSTFEADIFTFDPESKFNLRLNRKLYNQLVDRGYYFELLYSTAIEDSTKRKNLIHLSHLYHSFGKSRNIIFSSGAKNHYYIRSPYDVINLGFIFGLSEQKSKSSLIHYPHKVLINSVGRRHGKAVMFVENIEKTSDVINLDESESEDVVSDQPTQKKSKT